HSGSRTCGRAGRATRARGAQRQRAAGRRQHGGVTSLEAARRPDARGGAPSRDGGRAGDHCGGPGGRLRADAPRAARGSGRAPPPRTARDLRCRRTYGTVRLCMFTPRELQLERGWPGIIEGETVIQVAAQTLQAFFTGGGTARRHAEYALPDVEFRAPVLHPPSVRDFYAFEQHVKTARASRGLEVPQEWYDIPVFYFSNATAIYGPGDEI